MLDCEGFVLAGGRSSRFGQGEFRDKALAVFDGIPMIARSLAVLRDAGLTRVRIAGARSDLKSFGDVVVDEAVDKGPLGGVCAALRASDALYSVFLPVDMPLMPAVLPAYLAADAAKTGAVVTIASVNGEEMNFPAVLARSALPILENCLANGPLRVGAAWRKAAGSAPVRVVPVEVVAQTGCLEAAYLPARWFLNTNTQQELGRIAATIGARIA